jgi:hypothetical protein
MDSDALIKITKASMKDTIASNVQIYLPLEVKKETVDEGKVGEHADALRIEENIREGKLKVTEARRSGMTETLIVNLSLLGGEADSIRLFRHGGYEAIASDDSKFAELLEELGIPCMTPGSLLVYLLRNKRVSRKEALRHMERLRAFISSEEYMASVDALGEGS